MIPHVTDSITSNCSRFGHTWCLGTQVNWNSWCLALDHHLPVFFPAHKLQVSSAMHTSMSLFKKATEILGANKMAITIVSIVKWPRRRWSTRRTCSTCPWKQIASKLLLDENWECPVLAQGRLQVNYPFDKGRETWQISMSLALLGL